MAVELNEMLQSIPVVPLIQADDPEIAVRISVALTAGGLTVAEVVFRTDRALDCLAAVADQVPQMMAGAGTVLNADQAEEAVAAGARFIVSPGLDEGVVEVAKNRGVPVYPGVVTPTELQRAFNLGLEVVKFFPATLSGGIPALKALSSVFRKMRFMPTGGISPENLAEFLVLPSVLACGGSWLTPADAIVEGDYDQITKLAREAVAIATEVRGEKP